MLVFFIKLIISVSFLRPFTILIHELGHGIPALILTKGKVTLYIGSYGNSEKSFCLVFKRLEIYLKKENPLYWKVGLCKMHDNEVSIFKQFIVTLFGPIASLILAVFFWYLVFYTNISDDLKFVFFIFIISSLYDFYINIVPSKTPIILEDDSVTYNDGQHLKDLFKYRKFYTDYEIAAEYYNNKEYLKAATQFKKIIESGIDYDYVYRLSISSFLQIKNYKTALFFNSDFESKHHVSFNSDDFFNAGLIKSKLNNNEEALIDYTKSLELDSNNFYSLNNRGYAYNLISEYEKAILDFNKVIELDSNFAYAYNNRGLAKIKLGNSKDGLKDIERSMDLDNENSYAYMNLGIYFFDKQNYKEALRNFEIALKLDDDTFLIDKHIEETKLKLGLP